MGYLFGEIGQCTESYANETVKQDFTFDSYFLYRASEIHFVLSMRWHFRCPYELQQEEVWFARTSIPQLSVHNPLWESFEEVERHHRWHSNLHRCLWQRHLYPLDVTRDSCRYGKENQHGHSRGVRQVRLGDLTTKTMDTNERTKQNTETYNASEKQHSKTWLAMQKYRGTVTVYDKNLFN